MTTKVVPGMLVATRDADEMAREAATRMARAIRAALKVEGSAAIALSGGNTPKPAYALLAKEADIDWSKVDVYFVDERAVDPSSPRSNYRLAKESLLDAAKVPEARVHRMRGESKDLAAEAARYADDLEVNVRAGKEGPALDLVVLGVGDDGHTASLFPGTTDMDVTDRLVIDVPASGEREARLTITAPVIEQAKAVFVLATGASKSAPLERAWSVNGDAHETPARVIRGARGAITWIIDRAAGGITG